MKFEVDALQFLRNLVHYGMGLSLSYDATGRMVQGTNGIAMQTSGYNALGQRMSRQVVGAPEKSGEIRTRKIHSSSKHPTKSLRQALPPCL